MITGGVAFTFKACEFRDEVRDKLIVLDRNWFYMREVDAEQSREIQELRDRLERGPQH